MILSLYVELIQSMIQYVDYDGPIVIWHVEVELCFLLSMLYLICGL